MTTAEAPRQSKFKEGDRVKPWGKSKDIGTVDETWFDGPNEIVAVVWDATGCVGDMRAHQLQHAS